MKGDETLISEDDLRPEEQKAIKRLEKLEKTWPETLWLFAGNSGTLYLMKMNEQGAPAMLPNGGVDPDYIVTSFGNIKADGGDW